MARSLRDIIEADERPSATNLMRRGLLPEILPPIFTSENLTGILDAAQEGRYCVTQRRRGKLAPFNASKRGEQRRIFAVPHPLFYHDAGLFFERNWDDIRQVLNKSIGSASKPRFPTGGFRAVEITPQSELPTLRLKTLSRKKFCLITDVSRCFPSVYTHAIPWALDGKEKAKADFRESSTDVKGNRLDFITRQAQDGQTAGIPVGPDTSRLISELILSRVDADFVQHSRKRVFFVRHVDDYWIGGDTQDECEDHLRRLRLGLAEYQLDINESKTRIVPLAHAIGETWPTELKKETAETFPRHAWGTRPKQQDVTSFFSKVVALAVKTHDDGIIKYVIRQIDRAQAWDSRWDVLEPVLAHCAIQFPHCFDYVARVIAWRIRREQECDKRLWKEVALSVGSHAASLGHDSELAWVLWLLKELGTKLSTRQVEQITRVSGPLVLSLIAHMVEKGLAGGKSTLDDLEKRVVGGDQFTGALWPLSLELYHLGHSNRLQRHSKAEDQLVGSYHAAKASIIDWDRLPRVFEPDGEPNRPHDWEPDFAIEDYASAYDDDEEDEDEDENAFDGGEMPF